MQHGPDHSSVRERAGLLATCGSVVSAVLASACCWLPLLLISLGLSAGGVSASLERYRLPFLLLTVALLGVGFYLAYARDPACAPATACTTTHPRLRRVNRIMLWIAALLVVGFAFFPSYAGSLFDDDAVRVATGSEVGTAPILLRIDGMTCEGCAAVARRALETVPGVVDATVWYPEGHAEIRIIDGSAGPSTETLIGAVAKAGYGATPSNGGDR